MQDIIEFLVNSIRNISVWSVLDISVVAFIFYKGYMLVKETRAEQLLKGIFLIIALFPISYILKLDMLYFILNKIKPNLPRSGPAGAAPRRWRPRRSRTPPGF